MRIAIADDEIISLEYLYRIVSSILPNEEIIKYSKTSTLLSDSEKLDFDIAFLDVQMPGASGIEIAQKMLLKNKKTNIIFVTGYSEYREDAMDMFASGYVTKPASLEKIKLQLDNLRYEIKAKKDIYAMTFGYFTLYVDEKPVVFHRNKSMMFIAYLIDRQGGIVSRKDIASVLFDDGDYSQKRQKEMSVIYNQAKKDLEEYGIGELLISTPNGFAINKNILRCDLFDYLDGKEEAKLKYTGEYMEQYYFGETFKGSQW